MAGVGLEAGLTVEFIRQCVASGDYELSLHADEERLAEGRTIVQVESALLSCEMLEEYPNDPRGPSCLVLGFSEEQPLHVVCGITGQRRHFIITVYHPDLPKWVDPRTRREKE